MSYSGARSRRSVNYVWVSLVAVVTLVLGWAANAAIALVTEWSGAQAWLAVPFATVALAVFTAVATAHVRTYEPEPSAVHSGAHTPPPDPGGRAPFAAAMLAVAVVVGIAGLVLTLAVRFAVGWVTGDESGSERLVEAKSVTSQGLTLSVESIEQTRHFTRVTAVATSEVGNTVTLRVFGSATLQAGDGTTIEADAFRSDWVEKLPPGGTRRGVIVFGGHLPDEARFARFAFATVFRQGFHGPENIAVVGMRLRPGDTTN